MKPAILIGLLCIATPSFSAGVLSYTARPAVVGARPGDTVGLVATLRNTGDTTLYVNGVSAVIEGPVGYLRENPFFNFFNSVPGTFEPTDSPFTGSVREIVVDPNTPPGAYTVTVRIAGGGDAWLLDPVNNEIGSQTFTIIVVQAGAFPYAVSEGGGTSVTSRGGNAASTVGHGRLQPFTGNATPAGLAIIGLRHNDVLISETAVPAQPAIQAGRIYAEVSPAVNTGIALANPNGQAALVSFYFTNANGDFGSGTTTIPANGQIASFLDQAPFRSSLPVNGAFTFNSSVPIAAVSTRGRVNERGEFLMSTLPVADLSIPATTTPLIFPQVVDGGGWTTQIVLVNTGDTPLSGTVQFFPQSGGSATTSSYSIARKSSQTLQTEGTSANVTSGWARVVQASNTASPAGMAVFSYRSAGVLITEAGVPAVAAATGFQMYTEASGAWGSSGSIQTGIAIVNASAAPAVVSVHLTKLDGTPAAFTGTLSLPANGQTAAFLGQIPGLDSIELPFRGVARISSSAPISLTGFRARYNERLDFLVTTTQAIPDTTPPSDAPLYFPQIADSGGYTTQFIIFGGPPDAGGTLQLSSPSGAALNIQVQ